ncbi:MAG: nuclear transport factor 2 family protein, partial [Thermoplasmatota archaeon]
MQLDEALESMDIEKVISLLHEDFELEMLGTVLKGKEGARKGFNWLLEHVDGIRLEPVVIMVEDDVFFEEFVVDATLKNGVRIRSKQAEVLIYRDYKVTSLRLYFDRLDFADSIARGPIERKIVDILKKRSLQGLT